MTLTTPPRPYEILTPFPELAAYAKSAVRLHPRPGTPSIDESSVGGPLLWPVDEPWPTCELEHEDWGDEPFDYVRAERAFLSDRDRREELGEKLDWAVERERLHQLRLEHSSDNHPDYDEGAPQPLIPVAQLYMTCPACPGPTGTTSCRSSGVHATTLTWTCHATRSSSFAGAEPRRLP
ncbi:hypothetical protein [Glycomyces tritici]|uniref:Uncharacterized protein n=1 Tax=Glycomyces tritici TaxID=2665176 RepID=A0ABT7YNT9_9ACTN|nr:hypothetical protein [Glycomyces tritici]MDN3240307.1 hypothetical protein [Glycomyces tritici]